MVEGIRAKAVPYYACFIVRVLALADGPVTLDGLIESSSWVDSDVGEDGYYLEDRILVSLALDFLNQNGAIERFPDEFGPELIVKSSNFNQNVARLSDDRESPFYKSRISGSVKWLIQALISINIKMGLERSPGELISSAPQEVEWEPLALERTSPSYDVAMRTSEEALKAIEDNNGYAASSLEERNGIVNTIRGTILAIRDGSPSRESIIVGLVRPLTYISKKFTDSAMGELAKIAVNALIKWLAF